MTRRQFFGTDGIRGVAGEDPLTAPWVLGLGAAAAEVLGRGHRPTVVIGKDTRQSGDMLEAALTAGLTARGADVIHVGVLPTPGVSFLTRQLEADAGVVISASHNPYQDNGIKFFGASGQKLSDELELEMEAMLSQVQTLAPINGRALGAVNHYTEAERLYLKFLLQHAPDLSGMRVAMDCANGAAYRVAPGVFQQAGADVFAVYTTPDGHNINRGCGSTHLEHLQRLVREGGYNLGVAFDGDADRCLFIDSRGNVVHGDHMLLLNARARQEQGVVTTIMSNMALEVKLRESKIALHRTAVGDRYVHEGLTQQGLSLGGEQSGHVLFLDASPTGDGVLTALLTLAAARQQNVTLDALYDELQMFPQSLVSVRVPDKQQVLQDPGVQAALEEAEARLSGRGRVNVRPSGTENLVRVMVEGPEQVEIEQISRGLVSAIEIWSQVRAAQASSGART